MANRRRCDVGSHSPDQPWRSTGNNSESYPRILQPSVPQWERKFCFEVGSVTWKRLLESHKFISLSDKVIQWDDLAVKKAFYNAKKRYWAKINSLPCKISMPNPDAYIDKIDWSATIDPELLSGLEEARAEVDAQEDEEERVADSHRITLDQIEPTGWDDVYEEPKLLTGMIVGDGERNKVGDDGALIENTREN